jgi:mannose-1-phosphate guanylyltransferase
MDAIILAGGLGSRMHPLTEQVPKPLLRLVGSPILAHIADRLKRQGIGRAILATGHLTAAFTPAVLRSAGCGLDLTVSAEDEPLGTAGALVLAAALLDSADDAVVVVNGDSLTHHDLVAQIAQHRATSAGLTVHVRHAADARAYGLVQTGPKGVVSAFTEKPAARVAGLVNAGTYVVQRELLAGLSRNAPLSLERACMPKWAEAGLVRAYREDAYVADLGTPASLLATSRALVSGDLPSHLLPRDGAVGINPRAEVAASASLLGDSYVDEGALVEDHARVIRSILMPNARVRAGATVIDSILDTDAVVPAGTVVRDQVIGGR